jgi:hypothetical protein
MLRRTRITEVLSLLRYGEADHDTGFQFAVSALRSQWPGCCADMPVADLPTAA